MRFLITLVIIMLPSWLSATPFETCPSKAFLVQQATATLSGVNLVSGRTQQLTQDMGTTGKINGMGFNQHDRYLYGWGYEFGTLVQIGSDYQSTPLALTDAPQTNFFVGDVATTENTYFAYRRGADYGLYAISLDENSPNYLQALRITDGNSLSLNIYDLAFHPDSGMAYSVDRNGQLYELDVYSGDAQALGNVGESGTFGAVYFDVEGTLYISRNSDGYIFRIDPMSSTPTAQLFAVGPASSNNDGARCAIAPLVDEDDTSTDYGDAPESYATSLSSNGPRHELVDGGLYLGQSINGEPLANLYPAADSGDDGVAFLSGFERGLPTLLQIQASQPGYLNAWLDLNRNGVFDDAEQLLTNDWLSSGSNIRLIDIPESANNGETWFRFRVSHEADIGPSGGTVDGEVEDYSVTITDSGVYAEYYPSADQWLTLAYEDNWPELGDYDSNDVVVGLRITSFRTSSEIRQYRIEGQINAIGASYHNGFAIRLPGVAAEKIAADSLYFEINGQVQSAPLLEAGRQETILMVSEDLWDLAQAGGDCRYFRTETGCDLQAKVPFKLLIGFNSPVEAGDAPAMPFDPFIFATPGTYHGDLLGQPGRGWEVHLKNQPPTEAFDDSLLGLADDYSNPAAGLYFQSGNGLPWAFAVTDNWLHPLEYQDLNQAYPQFQYFVENAGATHLDWFLPGNRSSSLTISHH